MSWYHSPQRPLETALTEELSSDLACYLVLVTRSLRIPAMNFSG